MIDKRELSLYNWVNTPAGAEMVVGFPTNSSEVMTYNGLRDARWSQSQLTPIPITPEFLEKNYFQRKEAANGKMVDWEIARIGVRKYEDESWFRLFVDNTAIQVFKLTSVHSLQNALRLAGVKRVIQL